LTRPVAHSAAPRVLFAGGGTGGHVYPAIAIANALRAKDPRAAIAFAGTRERLEWTAVPKAGYPIHEIDIAGFPRELSTKMLTFPFRLMKGLRDSFELIKGFRPDVVVGTGGYVSGPVLWAASWKNIPTLIQEQNAFAGATNKILGKKASKIFLAFTEAKKFFPSSRCVVSGNPVREAISERASSEAKEFFGIAQDQQVLFVFGGSLGSRPLNNAMLSIVEDLTASKKLSVIWQTGRDNFDKVKAVLKSSEQVKLLPYVDRMDLAYGAADLVLCRAGAITCSELMMVAKPSVLVPLPSAAEDHQSYNAQAMVDAGAAVLLKQSDMESQLLDSITSLLSKNDLLEQMSAAAKKMAMPQAAKIIAEGVSNLANGRSSE